ncbi:hypothetical protein E2C01_029183 [Portunus trituberculatus]|uniref:Uncharacterized protein n=1 Tax=Portunus trituberculatus TaxID=210409 RepID=A0A5B7ER64_PORTR|nr:hypothetical protein [Portunus trituberculatus]
MRKIHEEEEKRKAEREMTPTIEPNLPEKAQRTRARNSDSVTTRSHNASIPSHCQNNRPNKEEEKKDMQKREEQLTLAAGSQHCSHQPAPPRPAWPGAPPHPRLAQQICQPQSQHTHQLGALISNTTTQHTRRTPAHKPHSTNSKESSSRSAEERRPRRPSQRSSNPRQATVIHPP